MGGGGQSGAPQTGRKCAAPASNGELASGVHDELPGTAATRSIRNRANGTERRAKGVRGRPSARVRVFSVTSHWGRADESHIGQHRAPIGTAKTKKRDKTKCRWGRRDTGHSDAAGGVAQDRHPRSSSVISHELNVQPPQRVAVTGRSSLGNESEGSRTLLYISVRSSCIPTAPHCRQPGVLRRTSEQTAGVTPANDKEGPSIRLARGDLQGAPLGSKVEGRTLCNPREGLGARRVAARGASRGW